MGNGLIHRQAHLNIMVEDDGIALLKAEGVDDCSALDAANTTFAGPRNAAGGPRRAASWALLINEGIIAKGGFVRHHCPGGGGQREHAHRLDSDSQGITNAGSLNGHRARHFVPTTEVGGDHRSPAARRHHTTNASSILNRCRKTQAGTNEPPGVLIYKDLILDVTAHCLHERSLLSFC